MLRDNMRARITRLHTTQIADLIIVALIIAALVIGGYNCYVVTLHPPLKKAEFQVANLTVNPVEAGVGQSIIISVNVTNVGEEAGNYSLNLTINDVVKENKTVHLSGGTSEMVEFMVAESSEGSYSIKIEGLNGTFIITDLPPPPTLEISDLIISPKEAWVGDPIKISVEVSNIGDEAITYPLAFRVNNAVRETKTIQLSAGETETLETNVTESSEGTYSVVVGGLTGKFKIVPTGKHTLSISSNPWGLPFTINGVSHKTQYSELLDVGAYTVTMPDRYETPSDDGYIMIFQFTGWGDGVISSTRTIDLQSSMLLVAKYLKIACCPSLYVWNGTNYVYRAEVSAGQGYLPYFVCFGENGTRVFGYSDPWDYIKIDGSQLQPRNGYYDMTLAQKSDEIFYIDTVKLRVVDHSPDVDVYSTMSTREYNLKGLGKIYTVSKNPLTPISAVYGGENVLAQISNLDGIYTTRPSDWEYQYQWDTLELDLGDLSDAKEIKLIVAGIVFWPPSEVTAAWVAKFVNRTGEPPFPTQYMEVKDENGNWARVPDNRQFPMLDVVPDSFVVNLTGLFPTNDYSLRINMFFDWRFDYIGVDTTPQQNVTLREIYPVYADFAQVFETYSTSTGVFTRYGDVTPLVLEADDKFVIGRQGDQVTLKFLTTEIGPVPEGMERDYFVVVSCWFKVPGLPYLAFTVDPLPFHDMSCFLYPPTESYPYDEDHLKYLRDYNTREIAPES
jgi:hypothetical protein